MTIIIKCLNILIVCLLCEIYIFALIIRVKNMNKPKYSGEIFTTVESRKNIQ